MEKRHSITLQRIGYQPGAGFAADANADAGYKCVYHHGDVCRIATPAADGSSNAVKLYPSDLKNPNVRQLLDVSFDEVHARSSMGSSHPKNLMVDYLAQNRPLNVVVFDAARRDELKMLLAYSQQIGF